MKDSRFDENLLIRFPRPPLDLSLHHPAIQHESQTRLESSNSLVDRLTDLILWIDRPRRLIGSIIEDPSKGKLPEFKFMSMISTTNPGRGRRTSSLEKNSNLDLTPAQQRTSPSHPPHHEILSDLNAYDLLPILPSSALPPQSTNDLGRNRSNLDPRSFHSTPAPLDLTASHQVESQIDSDELAEIIRFINQDDQKV